MKCPRCGKQGKIIRTKTEKKFECKCGFKVKANFKQTIFLGIGKDEYENY